MYIGFWSASFPCTFGWLVFHVSTSGCFVLNVRGWQPGRSDRWTELVWPVAATSLTDLAWATDQSPEEETSCPPGHMSFETNFQGLLTFSSLLLNHLPGQNLIFDSYPPFVTNDHVLPFCSFGLLRPNKHLGVVHINGALSIFISGKVNHSSFMADCTCRRNTLQLLVAWDEEL